MDNKLYRTKAWVDVLDQGNVWRLARIKKVSEGFLTVSFDGWSDRFNMVLCYHSPRLAPPRMHSKGYTGQVKYPLRDYDLSLSMLKLFEHKISLFKKQDMKAFNAYSTTVFLRADLFVLVEELLSRAYFVISSNYIRKVEPD